MDPTVIGLVTAGLTEVKDAVSQLSRDLHGTLNSLPNEYVPRRELERRLDEFTIDIAEEKQAREAGARAMAELTDRAAKERADHRRWIITLAVGTFVSSIGVVSGIAMHFT